MCRWWSHLIPLQRVAHDWCGLKLKHLKCSSSRVKVKRYPSQLSSTYLESPKSSRYIFWVGIFWYLSVVERSRLDRVISDEYLSAIDFLHRCKRRFSKFYQIWTLKMRCPPYLEMTSKSCHRSSRENHHRHISTTIRQRDHPRSCQRKFDIKWDRKSSIMSTLSIGSQCSRQKSRIEHLCITHKITSTSWISMIESLEYFIALHALGIRMHPFEWKRARRYGYTACLGIDMYTSCGYQKRSSRVKKLIKRVIATTQPI